MKWSDTHASFGVSGHLVPPDLGARGVRGLVGWGLCAVCDFFHSNSPHSRNIILADQNRVGRRVCYFLSYFSTTFPWGLGTWPSSVPKNSFQIFAGRLEHTILLCRTRVQSLYFFIQNWSPQRFVPCQDQVGPCTIRVGPAADELVHLELMSVCLSSFSAGLKQIGVQLKLWSQLQMSKEQNTRTRMPWNNFRFPGVQPRPLCGCSAVLAACQ